MVSLSEVPAEVCLPLGQSYCGEGLGLHPASSQSLQPISALCASEGAVEAAGGQWCPFLLGWM